MFSFRLITLAAGFSSLLSIELSAQAVVGDVAPDQIYSVFGSGGSFSADSIRANTGKVVVLYYYTPW